jgi:hypothetical protein
MTEYLPYIFGTVSFLGGIYLFLYFFKIYKPKFKTDEAKSRYEKAQAKFGTISKIASIVMILSGGYDLIVHDTERYTISNNVKQNEWTKEDRERLISDCIQSSGTTGKKYPVLIKKYCECSTNRIISSLTKDQFIEENKKTKEEQMKSLLPVFQNCLDELKIKIDSADNKINKNGL